ncbi:MAG TPA: quinoprotein dehydrogenase-associated putative ABC transporter substrate-binding protein [Steroidobacteraceae bacterium]|nr:quinoprotein dehydrogenase-associated putative ABC transporter substrate-binding protein [Steroidobacteraceae bacterium]
MRVARFGLIALLCGCSLAAHAALVVCADPNNMPFSNRHEDGFENQLAQLLGRDLHMPIKYEWWAQRRGFARQTLTQSRCDIWPGVAAGIQSMATSIPYYRSTYVFVSLASNPLDHLSLDDPRLRNMLIGVQLVGDDGMNTPPASALAARGMTGNVRGFTLYGDYRRPNPPTAILDAVVNRSVKLALVWGPLAGYYARHCATPLRLEPIASEAASAAPMSFAIAVGVRRNEPQLRARINDLLQRDRTQIQHLLHQYGVPLVNDAPHSAP